MSINVICIIIPLPDTAQTGPTGAFADGTFFADSTGFDN